MASQARSAPQVGGLPPGLPPPLGVTPNFVNPESVTGQAHVVFVMCLVFSTLFVFLRMYTKLILLKSHGWEDCESLPRLWCFCKPKFLVDQSQIFVYSDGYVSLPWHSLPFLGVSFQDVMTTWVDLSKARICRYHCYRLRVLQPWHGTASMGCAVSEFEGLCAGTLIRFFYWPVWVYWQHQCVNAKEILNSPAVYFVKVSILLQFQRIFVPLKKGTAFYFIRAIIWLNGIYYIVTFFAGIFTCVPRRKIWEPAIPGHCLNSVNWFIASGLVNVVSDFAILMIPIFCISMLQMPLKRKIGISAVFAIGLLWVTLKMQKLHLIRLKSDSACSTSIVRAVESFRLVGVTDQTWELVPLAYWSFVLPPPFPHFSIPSYFIDIYTHHIHLLTNHCLVTLKLPAASSVCLCPCCHS